MMLRKFLYTCLLVSCSTILYAENHQNKQVDEEFKSAIKHVEKKRFYEAYQIFSTLAKSGIPEAQFNLALLYSNGLGTPKNFRLALYWSWQAHLNDHETAIDRVNTTYDLINEDLRNSVAQAIIEELVASAQEGDRAAPLKLGKTYLGLFVEAQNQPAYLWLSISQAYGEERASALLEEAASQMTLEEILAQQEEAQKSFNNMNKKN
jgi:TPR repeat protein|tara:strand:+ start:807 stop:1427 length:621 start_codon:yes stop_codon:yes gene_type:complete